MNEKDREHAHDCYMDNAIEFATKQLEADGKSDIGIDECEVMLDILSFAELNRYQRVVLINAFNNLRSNPWIKDLMDKHSKDLCKQEIDDQLNKMDDDKYDHLIANAEYDKAS